MTTDLDLFLRYASPTTLASLIVDIQETLDDGYVAHKMGQSAWRELIANVGDDEAKRLVEQMRTLPIGRSRKPAL